MTPRRGARADDDGATEMQTPVYAGYEAIEDDVHAVRKRETSRLWYRGRSEAAPAAEAQRLPVSFLGGSVAARVICPAATVGTSSLTRRVA